MADLVITNVQQHEGKNDDTNNTKKRKLITIPQDSNTSVNVKRTKNNDDMDVTIISNDDNENVPTDIGATTTTTTTTTTTRRSHAVRNNRNNKNNPGKKKPGRSNKNNCNPSKEEVIDEIYFKNKVWMKTKHHWVRFLAADKEYNSTGGVCISYEDKAEKLLLSMQDGLHLFGHKGYRSARCTYGVNSGTWYCEFEIKDASKEEETKHEVDITHKDKANVRVGWGTKLAELQAPIGYDAYGYGYRDLEGHKLHKSCRELYGDSYGPGDVIGMLIHFADDQNISSNIITNSDNNNNVTKAITFGNVKENGIEQKEDSTSSLSNIIMKTNTNHIRFFKNGIDQGIAFTDISRQTLYFPTVSLYYNAYVKFNPGPNFKFSPKISTKSLIPKVNGNNTNNNAMDTNSNNNNNNNNNHHCNDHNNVYANLKAYSYLGEGHVQKDMKEEEENFDALIFDLNGTIIDSMEYHYESYRAVCSEYNLKIDRETFYAMFGMDAIDFLKKLSSSQNQNLSQAEIENISNKRLLWYRNNCLGRQRGIHCVLKILKGAKESGQLKLALVSNETPFVINSVLKQLNLDKNIFDVIINNRDYINQKPNPEAFLLAAKKLRVAPSRIRAYGDSWYDIKAMNNAGMNVVDVKWLDGYPNQIAKEILSLKTLFLSEKNQ